MPDARLQAAQRQTRVPAHQLPTTTVLVDDAHVTYRVYEDHRQGLRHIVANRMRPRPSVRIHAVRGVSLTTTRGEIIGVVGSNGSGKSTLMRAISGALPVTEGAVYASSQPVLLGVGSALKPNLSGWRNIIIGGLALGLRGNEIDELMDEIIEFSGLRDSIDRPMRTYSSGMRARLQFAISTSVAPQILLLDEALAVGDEDFKQRSHQRIRELQGAAGTVFLVSHSLSEIRRTCTRALWLEQGVLMEDNDPSAVIKAYKSHLAERESAREAPVP